MKKFARELRRKMTLAEVLLWKRLKGRRIRGMDFDRQRPIDEFIVDFYCKDLSLAIEVDGFTHNHKRKADESRQRKLERLGVRFLRLWDYEVKNDMGSVVERIENWIDANDGQGSPGR